MSELEQSSEQEQREPTLEELRVLLLEYSQGRLPNFNSAELDRTISEAVDELGGVLDDVIGFSCIVVDHFDGDVDDWLGYLVEHGFLE